MKSLAEGAALCREKRDLPEKLIARILADLLDDTVDTAAKADFLRALTDKGETAVELAAFASELLPRAVNPGFSGEWDGRALLDCCGPGGGGLPIFNVSTGMVFILAALGVPVVKHGNRGVTKKSGSADVLEALGIRVESTPEKIRESLDKVGAAFLFAPKFHPAFAHLAPVRKLLAEEGRRTVFNLLGPILNPARPAAQLIGVFQREQLALFGPALQMLGRKRHAVVWGCDATSGRAIGEVSVTGSNVWHASARTESWKIPAIPGELAELEVASAAESAARITAILSGEERGLGRTLLAVNAAVALCVQDGVVPFPEALERVEATIDSGRALERLVKWRDFSAA